MTPPREERADGGRGASPARTRTAARAILAAAAVWLGANWFGGMLGPPLILALALDLACIGVLGWALATLIGIRRERRDGGS